MVIFRVLKKFNVILSHHQRVRIVELAVIMVISGFLETLSVSMIMPFMSAVMEPEEIMEQRYVSWFCGLLGIRSPRTFLIVLATLLAALYIFKNLFLIFQNSIQARFVRNNMFNTQKRLLRNYLDRPYEYYLEVKSGEVLRVIGEDTSSAFGIMTTLLSFFSETVISLALIVTLFVISPVVTTCIAAVLLLTMLLLLALLRPALRRAGLESRMASAAMNRWLLQSIQGIKEIKIMRKEAFFEGNFNRYGRIKVDAQQKHQILNRLPKYLIEAFSMATFFIIIAVMIASGAVLESMIPTLSAVAVAALRLLPSVNSISSYIASITYNEPRLDKMIENLKNVDAYARSADELPKKPGSIRPLAREIAFSGITYQYPAGDDEVLRNASMTVKKGMSVGIVGPSGAGKTTSVDIMLGLLQPKDGCVMIDGADIRLDPDGWLSQIGYIPQAIFMLDDSIRANVAFGVKPEDIDDEAVWRALKDAALDGFVRSLKDGLDTQLGERGVRLSGGQRQRIGIARALYGDPPVLFFDEATSSLDHETEASIMESVTHLHGVKTMIIIAHRLTTIEGCDAIFRVQDGTIVRER